VYRLPADNNVAARENAIAQAADSPIPEEARKKRYYNEFKGMKGHAEMRLEAITGGEV